MTTDRNSEGAVAWQVRRLTSANWWSHWTEVGSEDAAKERVQRHEAQGYRAEWRSLYTTPPASIPAAEVQALVERIESVLAFVPDRGLPGIAKDELRRELAKLIPRNPSASECLARAEAIAINSITGGSRHE